MAFAEENLFGPRHTLPAWNPHELLGAPFAANMQSFPLIPTRLLLLLFKPEVAFAPGVAIAALLAALFTYLFCRRLGLSEVASAASGWTFACAGYFATRIFAGHLPLLEAYPALPLLLWLADRGLDPERAARHRWDLAWLALAATCVVLAGHPQVPTYAVGAALLYVIWQGRGWLHARVAGAIVLGSALSLAVWWPMLLLIQKSTRILDLDRPDNDIVFPYRRLLSLLNPGNDGWPPGFPGAAQHPWAHGYPNLAYFYDTASYIGLAPLAAVAFLLVLCFVRKRLPAARFQFLVFLGVASLIAALPVADVVRQLSPGVILRSSSRLLYLTTFSLAVALGAGIDEVLALGSGGMPVYAAVAVILGLHGLDLGGFSRLFVRSGEIPVVDDQVLARTVKDGRIATDFSTWFSRRRFDDIGTFDSLLLARPYRALLDLCGASPRLNLQVLNGASLSPAALQAGAAVMVVTPNIRPDLPLIGGSNEMHIYGVPYPAPRAGFYGPQAVKFLPERDIPAEFRSHAFTKPLILMPEESRGALAPGQNSDSSGTVAYRRPSSDEIVLEVAAGGSGFVNVIETYDPGWSATVDSHPAPVFAANGFTLAAPVAAGQHTVRLVYRTPGRGLGIALSLLAAGLLAGLIGFTRSTVSAPAPARAVPPAPPPALTPSPQGTGSQRRR
jgi:hypothetical protein